MNAKRQKQRRTDLHLTTPLPAKVRGVNCDGKAFKTDAVIEKLSPDGLYMRLREPVKQGERLFVMLWFSAASDGEGRGPQVAIRGVVLEVDHLADGAWAVMMAFTRYRFVS